MLYFIAINFVFLLVVVFGCSGVKIADKKSLKIDSSVSNGIATKAEAKTTEQPKPSKKSERGENVKMKTARSQKRKLENKEEVNKEECKPSEKKDEEKDEQKDVKKSERKSEEKKDEEKKKSKRGESKKKEASKRDEKKKEVENKKEIPEEKKEAPKLEPEAGIDKNNIVSNPIVSVVTEPQSLPPAAPKEEEKK